jgi:trans-aconitate methyltransferase
MELNEAIAFISAAIPKSVGHQTWVDLGCGNGLFTHALANVLTKGSKILAIDKLDQKIENISNDVSIEFRKMDFLSRDFSLPLVNGILMANSFHYVENKSSLLASLTNELLHGGRLVIIEYDTDRSNSWVPFPIQFHNLKQLLTKHSFTDIRKVAERPSSYGAFVMYECVATKSQ